MDEDPAEFKTDQDDDKTDKQTIDTKTDGRTSPAVTTTEKRDDVTTKKDEDDKSDNKSEIPENPPKRVEILKQISETPIPVDPSEIGADNSIRQSFNAISEIPKKKEE